MKNNIYILVIALLTMSTVITAQNNDPSEKEMKTIWNQFLEVIASKDLKTFKQLSDNKIHCINCLGNTEIENEKINTLMKTDTSWYDKMYNELVYIPVDHFIENDFDIIFTPSFIKKLKEKKTIFFERTIDDILYFEVFVSTFYSKELRIGRQDYFRFKKVKNKWVFNGMGTIP